MPYAVVLKHSMLLKKLVFPGSVVARQQLYRIEPTSHVLSIRLPSTLPSTTM
jgi:hypothetical protein